MYEVLVADDEMIERMALVRRLKKHFGDSCRISEAGNGSEAVRICREVKAQIIIMDIAMPGMNGVEAAEEIRKTDKGCSIIFLTAYDDFVYTRKAIIVRALDYLLKPCDENELISVMEEAMRLEDVRGQGQNGLAEGGEGQRRSAGVLFGEEENVHTGAPSGVEAAVHAGAPSGVEAAVHAGAPSGVEAAVHAGALSGKEEAVHAGALSGAEATVHAGTPSGAEETLHAGTLSGAEAAMHAGAQSGREDSPQLTAPAGELRMNQVAQAMQQYIRDHYMKDISMQDAARALNYSDVYFCKLFKQCFDQNFTSYLAQYRIDKAKLLLTDPSVNVKEAGMSVGYSDPNYFAKVFKRMTGMIPSEYKNRHCEQKTTR